MKDINNIYLNLYNIVNNRLKEYNLIVPFEYESLIRESQLRKDSVDIIALLKLDGEEFVKACYSQLLGRKCSLDEIELYTSHLKHNSIKEKSLIIYYFVNSGEYLNDPISLENNVVTDILSISLSFFEKVLKKIKKILGKG